jgi:hypothetical protein
VHLNGPKKGNIGIKYPFLISWREQGSNDCTVG